MDTGNTGISDGNMVTEPVQPRGYGEHVDTNAVKTDVDGSAPWIRGTPSLGLPFFIVSRFSPVDTGNTRNNWFLSVGVPVQPRGYGEHPPTSLSNSAESGSAPWIRGTPERTSTGAVKKRFSPVDTGNT